MARYKNQVKVGECDDLENISAGDFDKSEF